MPCFNAVVSHVPLLSEPDWYARAKLGGVANLSGETLGNSALFASVVWMRRETKHRIRQHSHDWAVGGGLCILVRTNWPTVAPKPERKALKG